MNGDQSVRLQFPADAGTTEVVSVLSAGVAERFGLTAADAEQLASAVCSAVTVLIDAPLICDGEPPSTETPASSATSANPDGMIQVTFSPETSGLRAVVARPGLWFGGTEDAERAWKRLTERIGDKVSAIQSSGVEAAYRFAINKVRPNRGG